MSPSRNRSLDTVRAGIVALMIPVLGSAAIPCQDYASPTSPVTPLVTYDEGLNHQAGSERYSLSWFITWDGGYTSFGYRIWDLSDPLEPVIRLQDGDGGFYLEPFYSVLDVQDDVVMLSIGNTSGEFLTAICDMAAEPAFRREFTGYEAVSAVLDLPHAWILTWDELVCLDVSDLHDPRVVSVTPAPAGQMIVEGARGFLVTQSYPRVLSALDLTDPAAPVIGTGFPLDGLPGVGTYRDGLAYLGSWDATLRIVDVRDVDAPALLGEVVLDAPVLRVLLRDDLALAVSEDRFQVVSIGDPTDIAPVSPPIATGPIHSGGVWEGDILYLGSRQEGVQAWNLAEPAAPQLIGVASGPSQDIRVGPDYVVAAGAVYPLHCLDQTAAVEPDRPTRAVRLVGAEPNPFNPRTSVVFTLERSTHVVLRVHDVRGRLVRTLHEGSLPAGRHQLDWDGRDDAGHALGSGVYLLRLEGDGATRTRRCTLVR
ncbi:T9SS type A sorting domain-containing protein [bacterium]|nr:T9SS type A sorting domain-containing protein [bacterium]